ncbi:MAG: isoaspartyl peptidase/L-asparaginase [Deinococcales bacterium]
MAILLLHGGAGAIADDVENDTVSGLASACDAGFERIPGGASEAALSAVTAMEANELAFNAGIGGAPTREGTVELDAAVMLSDGTSGAVAVLRTTPFAARLADRVRTETPHALLAAHGAEALVTDPVPNERLLTARSIARWRAWRERQTPTQSTPTGSGTVGAVALDDHGSLAAVTSTGGTLGQWSGRIGDTPLIGAGTYADRTVAVSCTGKGEAFIRAVTAKALADRLSAGADLERALQEALEGLVRFGGDGGLIVVTADGRFGVAFNSASMAMGWRWPGGGEQRVARRPGVVVMGG